ncbi:MAG: hypothetical protein NC411_02130 [Bacteroides sp.]|nr:hypothetical protein [Bacteroides sp.]
MTDFLIYGGLGIMLLGAIFGLMAAIKGFALSGYKIELIAVPNPEIKKKIRKYTRPALIFLIAGAVILAIGIGLGLEKN